MSLDVSAEDISAAEDVRPDVCAEDPRPCGDGSLEPSVDFLVTGEGSVEHSVDCLSMSAIRGAAGAAVSTMFFTPWLLRRSCSPTAATSW